jgi:hypothetical protein
VVSKSGGQKDLTERHTYVIIHLDISTLSVCYCCLTHIYRTLPEVILTRW